MARVLVCDDEETMRTFLARAMRQEGHAVSEAVDGAHALEVMQAEEGFDLLITDIRMPVMDGIALALNVARDFPATAILLTTGYAEQRERAADLRPIIFDVISKPFTLAEICEKVASALASRTG